MFLLNAVKAHRAYGALCDLTIAWPAEALAKGGTIQRAEPAKPFFETLPISFRNKGTNTKKETAAPEITALPVIQSHICNKKTF